MDKMMDIKVSIRLSTGLVNRNGVGLVALSATLDFQSITFIGLVFVQAVAPYNESGAVMNITTRP